MGELKQRKQNRLSGYNYSKSGLYFITICAKEHERIFSEITDGVIKLTDLGEVIESEILNIPEYYKTIDIDCFVIMPNHIHAILVFTNDQILEKTPKLSTVINQLKGSVTKQIGYSPWQRSFYEHIIRDKSDYKRIVDYIKSNPDKWADDCYYTAATPEIPRER
jgi:REP element-mobilizing transposase RayT